MKTKNYRISEKAVQDLITIWEYTFRRWSKEQADRYYDLLINEIEFISRNPTSGISFNHIREDYYLVNVKSHLIFYKRLEGEGIEIIRILHQRMDLKKRLD